MKTFIILLISGIASFAQNVAVLTHGAANTPEFQRGCPSNWPAKYFSLRQSTNLPPELHSPPWIVETELQLKARFESLESAKEAWNVAQESAATQPKRDRDTIIRQAIDNLKTIRDSNGTLTAAQLSNAVRELAKDLLAIIEEL